jgi:hypothetical protein
VSSIDIGSALYGFILKIVLFMPWHSFSHFLALRDWFVFLMADFIAGTQIVIYVVGF